MSAKVSVLMPIYKTNEVYLKEAIESILNQTFTDFEFLILDDCPDDNREHIVKSYKDKRIKYMINEQNMGISAARNKLIDLAKGEYLAIFDHDDISSPTRLEKEVNLLDSHPEVGVVSSNAHIIGTDKDIINPIYSEDIKQSLMYYCAILHPASMIRKSVLENNHIYYEKYYSPAEDHKLWCRLINYTKFYNIPEVLLNYRYWKGNTSHNQRAEMKKAVEEIQMENKIKYPELWEKFRATKAECVRFIKFIGFIPLLKIVKRNTVTKILLFNFIPLLKLKNKLIVIKR